MFLYKKWSFIILLNNLIINSFLTLQKKIVFLKFDIYKYYFFNYLKTTNIINSRIIVLKNRLIQNI